MPTPGINVSGVILGNPIVLTSGCMNIKIDNGDRNMYKLDRVYWLQPTLESTSSFLITKGYFTTSAQVYMEAKAEVSGQSQFFTLGDEWWDNPYVACVPTGKVYIFLE